MIIGILNIELFIPGSNSLKTKRSAIKSIKDRLRKRYNVSVAEVNHSEKWQMASLGISTVSNKKKHAESILGKAINLVYGDRRVEVINSEIKYL